MCLHSKIFASSAKKYLHWKDFLCPKIFVFPNNCSLLIAGQQLPTNKLLSCSLFFSNYFLARANQFTNKQAHKYTTCEWRQIKKLCTSKGSIANHTITQEEKYTRKQTVKQKPSFSLWLQINLNQKNTIYANTRMYKC